MTDEEARARAETIERLMAEAGDPVVAIINTMEGDTFGEKGWHVEIYTPEQWKRITQEFEVAAARQISVWETHWP